MKNQALSKSTVSRTSTATRAFLISLVALILCSLVNWGLVTGWGNVRITRINLIADDGVQISALLYVPRAATNATPAPAVALFHGNTGNSRNSESWAVEYSRRGFVVISPDNFGTGDSEYYDDTALPLEQRNNENIVATVFCDYLLGLPFVDTDRLVSIGHSRGHNVSYMAAKQMNAKVWISCGSIGRAIGTEKSYFPGNILALNGGADGGSTQRWHDDTLNVFTSNGLDVDDIEYNVLYGSFDDGNARLMLEIPNQIHEAAFCNTENIGAQLDFVQNSFHVPNSLVPENQIWFLKDIAGFIGLHVFLIFLLATAMLLIKSIPLFSSIQQPMPRNIGLRGKGLAISIICGLIFPVIVVKTGGLGLYSILGLANTPLFKLQIANYAFSTMIGISTLGFFMLMLFYFTDGKKQHATLRDFGLTSEGHKTLDVKLIGKSFLLALLVVFCGWTYLTLQSSILGTDFFCLYFGIRAIPVVKFVYYIPYIIVWLICFLVTSIGLNVERRLPSTGSERKDLAIAVVFNTFMCCITIIILIVVQNQLKIMAGNESAVMTTWGIDITRLWGMPTGMAFAGVGHTYMYRKTGSIWPGLFLMGIVCALMCCLYGQVRY